MQKTRQHLSGGLAGLWSRGTGPVACYIGCRAAGVTWMVR